MSAVISENALTILKARYLSNGESVDDMFKRVAGGNEDYFNLMADLHFLPNSPTLFNAGLNNGCTLSACFVFDVADEMGPLPTDSSSSIVNTRAKAIAVAKAGGGVGYYFGNIRPKGSLIKSVHRKACGPVAVMRDYHGIRSLVTQGGKRDLAQMGVLNCDHPDILGFVHCKDEDPKSLESFNISVSWTDEWLKDSLTPGTKAHKLWNEQVDSAWHHGCPGMFFWDAANARRGNPNRHLGLINAPNPCQPGSATVITRDGIRTFDDVDVGSVIWSGSKWTKVVGKVHTGTKQVFRFETTAGCFVGTKDHKVILDGKRVAVEFADELEICRGPIAEATPIDNQDVVDGWVIGDGTVHKASNNKVLLVLGAKDGCFHKYLSDFVVRHRPGIGKLWWHVNTTIVADELPRTFNRIVPDRFYHGSAEKIRGFLRGLYSANGCVVGGRINLKASSKRLIRQVQEMLSFMGIASYVVTDKASKTKFANGTYLCKESYSLCVTTGRKAFHALIGFVQDYKRQACAEVASRQPGVWSKKTYDIIRSVDLGMMPVYDITVDADEHTYWTSGVLVSNCGETPNRNGEPCNLGSIPLPRFYDAGNRGINWNSLEEVVYRSSCFLDDILDRNVFPHPDITKAALLTRKLGLGVMGWADLLAMMHVHYDTPEAVALGEKTMKFISDVNRQARRDLAKKKGPYAGYDSDRTEDECLRNETGTSIAPTGTIALIANVWGSIEPHFDIQCERTTNEGIKMPDGVPGWVAEKLEGFVPKTANEISLEWHVRHQAAFQKHTDLGCSKTINLPNSATREDVSRAYRLMHELGCKGGTIFRDGCRSEQVLVSSKKKSVYQVDAAVPAERKLPKTRDSKTHAFKVGETKCYLTVGMFDDNTPAEIFLRASRLGSTVGGMLDAWAKTFSVSLRSGTSLEKLCKHHKGDRFEPAGFTDNPELPVCSSIPDYVVRWLEMRYLTKQIGEKDDKDKKTGGVDSGVFCEWCGKEAIFVSGCLSCPDRACSWSRCG